MPKSKKPNRVRAAKRTVTAPARQSALQTAAPARHAPSGQQAKRLNRATRPPLFPGRTGGR